MPTAPARRRVPPAVIPIAAALAAVALVAAVAVIVRLGPATDAGRMLIAAQVSGLNLGRFGRLTIAGVHGDPWRDFQVDRLAIADRAGVWLDARDLKVAWRPAVLLRRRRLVVDTLAAREVRLIRRPILGPPTKGGPAAFSVEIRALAARLTLLPAFAQTLGVYDLTGALDAERGGGGSVRLRAASLTHAGDFLRLAAQSRRGAFTVEGEGFEEKGGALAGALGLAAGQPFAVTLRASGSAGAGRFQIGSRSGARAPVSGAGAWSRKGIDASGQVDLASSSFLERARRVLGNRAVFTLAGGPAAGRFNHVSLEARSPNAVLEARGEADLAHRTAGPQGLAVAARLIDTRGLVASPSLGPARLQGRLAGDLGHWVFTGDGEVQRLAAGGGYALARIAGPLWLEGEGGRIDIKADAQGSGGEGRGLIAALLGGRPHASGEASLFAGGRLLVRRLSLAGPGIEVAATGSRSLFGGLALAGQARVSNLAAAHGGARGLVRAQWRASQEAPGKPWLLNLQAKGEGFAAGLAELDRLLGPTPNFAAAAEVSAGLVAVKSSSLKGAAAEVSGSGTIRGPGALALELAWRAQGPFTLGPAVIDGAAKGSGALTGTAASPKVDLVATFDRIATPLTPLSDATVRLGLASESGGAQGEVAVTASSPYGPAKARSAFAFAQGGLDLTDLSLDAAGVSAKGSLRLRRAGGSLADLAFAVGPGQFLAAGQARGRLVIAEAPGGAQGKISLVASDARLRSGGAEVKLLKLEGEGPLARLPFSLRAEGGAEQGPWRLAGSGVVAEAGADRSLSFSGAGKIGAIEFHSLTPAEGRIGPVGASGHADLALGGGTADVRLAQNARGLTARAQVANVALSLLYPDLVGRLDGDLTLAGHGGPLTGAIVAKVSGVSGRDMRGQPPVAGEVRADLAAGMLSVSADFADSAGLRANARFTVPAQSSAAPFRIAVDRRGPLRGNFAVAGEVKPLWSLLMGGDRQLSGRVAAEGSLSGDLADPKAAGTADLTGGAFDDAQTGVKLRDVRLAAVLGQNAVDVRAFAAADGSGGFVAGVGRVSLERQGASSFRLDLRRFKVIDNDTGQAQATGALTVSRAADGRVELSGALSIDKAQIAPNPPVASGVVAMDVTEIHRPTEFAGETVVAARPAAPIGLDVKFRAPRGIFVKGRGLDVELALDAAVTGTTAAPRLTGVASVVRGDYDFAGRRFKFDDTGKVRLGSTPQTIRLDLAARREDPSLTAVIRIQGTAAKPEITLTSSPVLPADEVLSQVLFGASASQLTALQAAQVASAISGLAGGGGFDVMGGIRTFAHLDRLAFGSGPTETTVMGGKYLSDKVYLEVGGGGREGGSAEVDWRVRKHLSIVSRLTGAGGSELSIRWRKDY